MGSGVEIYAATLFRSGLRNNLQTQLLCFMNRICLCCSIVTDHLARVHLMSPKFTVVLQGKPSWFNDMAVNT